MIKPQNHILAAALMLLGGRALAQDSVPTDQEIINLYCDGKAEVKGRFVSVDGKTNLECDSGSARYLFEKINAQLGLTNKIALKKNVAEDYPHKWRKFTTEYLFEHAQRSGKCSKLEYVNDLPIFHCKDGNLVFNESMFSTYQAAFTMYYKNGAESFAKDPKQTDLAQFLMARDNKASTEAIYIPGALKDYFKIPELESKFPGFDEIVNSDFNKDFSSPRFWITRQAIQMKAFEYRPVIKTDDAFLAKFINQNKKQISGGLGANRLAGYKAKFLLESDSHNTAKTEVPPAPTPAPAPAPVDPAPTAPIPVAPAPEAVVAPKVESSCKDQLTMALTKLLESDKQNIIGHQFELTVLKLAALAVGQNKSSLEALVKKQSSEIAKMDKGIIQQMNQVYKDYGLKADAEKITTHFKKKAVKGSYFPRDKRFFNEDSSAYILAFQKMVPESGIKDTDVSVLWFMDKISKEVTKKKGKYTAEANLTNLSTRIAQYTGLTGAKKSYDQDELKLLAQDQQKAVNAELNGFIEDFKEANAACYKELFTDSKADCDLTVVEGSLSQILAVQSQIPSADLVNLEGQEGLDKSRFQLLKFANED